MFGTADAGRSWTRSAPIHAPGEAGWLTFADPAHGWLTSACYAPAGALLVTRDGGVNWASQPLPPPANACTPGLCFISPPQFFGSTGFLTIDHGGKAPYLFVTQDTGATWHEVTVPPTAGPFGTARFFSARRGARRGLLIPARSQDTPGQVFYLTADGGQAWTPVRQAMRFQPGMTADFVSPDTGFAWNPGTSGAPPIYATTDGGRTWTWYLPRLAPAGRQSRLHRPSG